MNAFFYFRLLIHKICDGENDIIIFATTHSNQDKKLGFVKRPEFLNVASSRQKKKLIIVGDRGETFSEGSITSKKIYVFSALSSINLLNSFGLESRGVLSMDINRYHITDKYMIRQIERVGVGAPCQTKVYNLEVEKENNLVAEGILVHNSNDGTLVLG
ncbi:MAG: AAA domain-containing protein, partial [Nitrososphaeraceae archaeon]